MRLELMRLDRKLKVKDLQLKSQQLYFEPMKMIFLGGGFVAALATVLNYFF
ncbi:MAG: hypothetical protein U1E24_14100 [Phenylobacterium sp.]|nr:hypothetical protein [Phenylobacterium sp.]